MEGLLYVGGLLVAAIIGWAVNFFAPGLFATIGRRPSVRVHIETDPAIFLAGGPNWESFSFVIPRDLAAAGTPPSAICREWWKWAHSMGAADADLTQVRVTVMGLSETDVLIDALQVQALRREQALEGTQVLCPVGGAEGTPRQIHIDLDQEPPVTSYMDDGGEHTKPFLFNLRKGEIETFYLWATAKHDSCQWIANLQFIVNGKRHAIQIDDHGHPFHTTATTRAQSFSWYRGEWRPLRTSDEPESQPGTNQV